MFSPLLARASIAGEEVAVPVIVCAPPTIVTLSDEIVKQVDEVLFRFAVRVYVPGAASSPQVEMLPGRSTAACAVLVNSENAKNIPRENIIF